MRTLVLSQVDQSFDPATHLVIGPRCFLGAEQVYPRWEDLPYVAPLDDPERQLEEGLKLRRLANHLIPGLAADLNRRHGRAYSVGYWRILLISWLLNILMVTRKRYLEMEALVERHGEEPFEVPVFADDVDWRLSDGLDLWERGLRHGLFDFWLTSRMAQALAPPHWKLVPVERQIPDPPARQGPVTKSPPNAAPRPAGHDMRNLPHRLARRLARHILMQASRRLLRRPAISNLAGLDPVPRALLSLWAETAWLFRNRRRGDEMAIDHPAEIQQEFPQAFHDVLAGIMRCTFPTTYREDFAAFEAGAKRLPYRRGRIFIPPAGNFHHVAQGKFEIAHAFEAGERIVSHQHGAGYGIFKSFTLHCEVEYRHHAFLSWGWSVHDHHLEGAIPVASPYLSRLAGRYTRRNDRLILVGTEIAITCNRLNSEPEPVPLLRYRRMKSDFVAALEEAPRRNFHYRQFQGSLGTLDDHSYLERRQGPILRVDGALLPQILECRLLVVDYPGTMVHLAVAAEVPLVCYWEPDAWPICDQATASFDALRDCGLLHATAESAAAHVNRIWPDIQSWWDSAEVRAARHTWTCSHARTSQYWWLHWARVLWTL